MSGRARALRGLGRALARSALTALLAVGVAAGTAHAQAVPARPNLVLIVADDLGWKDVGFHGSDIRTPSIDALARGGARLEQFYAQPMCTPTRAALMTGRYPFRYGLQTGVIPSGHTYGLATDEWLLPQALASAGYFTAIVGKWHLGHADRKYWPRQRGFAHQYGPMLGEVDYFTHSGHGVRDWFRDNAPVKEEGYVTRLLGDDAVGLIERHDPRSPLFLYLAFTAPHSPYQAPPEYLARYAGIADPSRRAYAAMITAMDDQIGRVVGALERRGLRDNTLIVFMSDNGGPRDASVAGEGTAAGELPPDNGPYRDGKSSLYEGGTRVVALANWPGRIRAGSVVDTPLHVVDLFPTFAKLGGASIDPARRPFDGVDAWPALAGSGAAPRNEIVYNIEAYRAAVRQGDWKLVWHVTLPSRVELFNLAQDPSEKSNLAAAHPDKVAELQRRIEALAPESVGSLLIGTELAAMMRRIATTPPALPKP